MASDERDKDGSPILGWVAVAAYVVFRLWVEKLNVPIAMWWVIREGPSRLDNSRGVLKWNLCGFTLPRNAAASRSKRYRVSARQDGDVADARCRT